MEKVAESIKAGDVVIIGNRPESAFIKCIDLKVACVIITGNTTISDEVVTKAKAEKCNDFYLLHLTLIAQLVLSANVHQFLAL